MNLFAENKQTHRLTDFEKCMVIKGDRWGRWEGWTVSLGLAYAY